MASGYCDLASQESVQAMTSRVVYFQEVVTMRLKAESIAETSTSSEMSKPNHVPIQTYSTRNRRNSCSFSLHSRMVAKLVESASN